MAPSTTEEAHDRRTDEVIAGIRKTGEAFVGGTTGRGRILVDTGRNDYSATFAAAYTVRARRGATVSAPCTWEEVERGEVLGAATQAPKLLSPGSFTIRNMAQRIENVGDLWSGLLKTKRPLQLPMERLDKMSQRERLS